ncbi:MAG: UDP-N-acetylmuramate dehydrogenase [Burkholderiales bacterium]|nr:UDP-N-acetylmuramate dehydrogenase [Burkholderiales bacterium]
MPDDFLIHSDFSLRQLNTFGIDAKAHRYVSIDSVNTLLKVVKTTEFAQSERFVLGGGSNILLTDDFPGLVLHIGIKQIGLIGDDEDTTFVRAAAGENWHQFVQWTLAHDLSGLENLSLIPGSVGAAPIQNIGAYGAEVKDFLHSVTVFDLLSGDIRTLSNAECGFGYRDSIFKRELKGRAVILDVTFALPKRWQPNLHYVELAQEMKARGLNMPTAREVSDAVIAIRTRKLPDPAIIGNAGSFFKNPIVSAVKREQLLAQFPQLVSHRQADGSYKLAAGWLIDQCGWKGKSMGAAGVYERQALVLVNRGGASGKEIVDLACAIQKSVLARFDVLLEAEPIIL